MTESMKFGPEWLRALSAQPATRYQLAEFRYGREEMLALFSANLPPPESLKQLHGLFVEKPQPPLALNTMSDEETRMWNRGINSDAVLRSVGKGERGGGLRGSGGGAGGRGGRGRGAFYRGSGERYEEGGDAPFPRQRPFDRSQSDRGRDSWSERNGGEGRGGGRDRDREREPNWRRSQRGGGGGDEDEWRPYSSANKWSVSGGRSSNWREEDSYDMNQTHSNKNSNHHLPEWATEKNSEGGGTFDSSGAFHGPSEISEEEELKKNENRISGKEKDRDRGSSNKNDLSDKEREDRKLDIRESPKESKSPEKDEGSKQKCESALPGVHSPNKRPPPNSQQPPTALSQPPSQQSQPNGSQMSQLQNQHPLQHETQLPLRAVKTPSPSPQTMEPTPSVAERKSPPHTQRPSPLLQQQQPQPLVQGHKSSPNQIHHPPPPHHQSLEHQEDMLSNMTDDLAADLVAKLMEDEEKQDKQWFYRDPQGQVQGPFTCTEMAEWFQSGYFTLNLMVRRACDPNYAPLGELIKLWGCIPFLPEFHPLNKEAAAMLNNQMQETYMMQQYQQQMRNILYRQQQQQQQHQQQQQQQQQQPPQRPQSSQVPKLHDWMDTRQSNLMEPMLPSQYQPPQVGVNTLHQQTNTNSHLRALLAQLQQQAKAEPPPVPVMETLISLAHQQQAAAGQTPIQVLLKQMQQQSSKLQHHSQQHSSPMSTIDSVWNGAGNWNQWGHVNTKGIKTEQQVIEEQLRAEYLRQQREEILKAAEEEEAKGKEEEEKAKKEREKHQQELAKREEESLQRRRAEEEEIRKKQEASRRAEVERQKKGEEKRRKEEEKRKKEEEKRRKEEENRERERVREEERKKKEAEEVKRCQQAAADLMAKVQRSQWCPPAASNTSILDIQRSEREQQQLLRGLQQQAQQHLEQQQQQHQQQNINSKGGLQLKWTEAASRPPTQVESLADIQAEQQRQFLKQLEKEKEREKEKVTATAVSSSGLGSWSQGLSWGTPAWQAQGLNPVGSLSSSQKGFWEYDKVSNNSSSGGGGGSGRLIQPQPEPPKSVQNKAKREEQAVMKLFSQNDEDEFSQWCSRQLSALHANVDIPTFVSFLREIDSPSDIGEYVRMYLGDSKEASDFARQFVERRGMSGGGGRLNSTAGLHSSSSQDDRDFQQVKGKSKKTKKGRMQKVDTKMLGFSTAAAPDRINVGDREYPE